ncbi:MAG: hypothetical protein IT308_12240 [Anaerolineaceae bacterium]|nr:hypothetical protein [Anaerolineaceae bacterium]
MKSRFAKPRPPNHSRKPVYAAVWIAATLAAIVLAAVFTPLEQTLGANLRLILVHGAWAWAGLTFFALAALAGLAGLAAFIVGRKEAAGLGRGSRALGWTALTFWLTYLSVSLWVMQANWGGFFFDEPRWRIPFTFAVVGVLLQIGLAMVERPVLTMGANLLFGGALWFSLLGSQTILHPESPVAQSGARSIQAIYGLLLGLMLLLGLQITLVFLKLDRRF